MHTRKRGSGILLHLTSLPSSFGIGDLGPWALKFVDILSKSKQRYWMILPLSPTSTKNGNSPYNAGSLFAGNTLLISPEILAKEKLLPPDLLKNLPCYPSKRVDYRSVTIFKNKILKKSYDLFKKKNREYKDKFESFCYKNSKWLDDYTLYTALTKKIGKVWYLWPQDLRDREKKTLKQKSKDLKNQVDFEKYSQFIFFTQLNSLKDYCKTKGISIVGDIPFYVNHDSADMWSNQAIFKLDVKKKPAYVGGVPPDYFSKTGQLWGTPVYNWEKLACTNFKWWIARIEHSLEFFDLLRIDHFRGLLAYWEVPAGAKTAKKGNWIKTPSEEFFKVLFQRFPQMPFIAEDLGTITSDVKEAIEILGIPGMKVLLFAFDGSSDNSYLPHNHTINSVVLTGTHDTNTVKGWFKNKATSEATNRLFRYIGKKISESEVSWEFIKLAMASVSRLSILPIQDVLSLGEEARMNHPSFPSNNWEWRVTQEQLNNIKPFEKLKEITEISGRN